MHLLKLGAFFFLAVALSACSATKPAAQHAGPDYLYVANQNAATVSVIDMEAMAVVETVDLQALGFSINSKPHHVAVEADGSYWYVSLIGAGKVLKFDRQNELVAAVDFETPGMLVLDPGSGNLYVGRSMMAANPPQRIGVIDRQGMTIDELDVFFPRPHALAWDPVRGQVITASLAENRIAILNPAEEEKELVTLEGDVHTLVQFALSPDGNTLVVGGHHTAQLLFFDARTPGQLSLIKSFKVGPAPWHPTFTPDGRFVYIGNKMANTVTVVDMNTMEVVQVIEGNGLSQPHGIAVSADGRYVFVSNNNLKGAYTPQNAQGPPEATGTVVVINTATRSIEKVIEVGAYPAGIGTRTPRYKGQ